jgi:hypothetical protein
VAFSHSKRTLGGTIALPRAVPAPASRTFQNLCDEGIKVNRSGPTRWNMLEVAERTERRFEIKVTRRGPRCRIADEAKQRNFRWGFTG